MLSRMHLHCCRWWSFQIRAVPSRLPLTNLTRPQTPRRVTVCTVTQNSEQLLWETDGEYMIWFYFTFHLSGRTGCCRLCPVWEAESRRVSVTFMWNRQRLSATCVWGGGASHRVLMELWYLFWTPTSQIVYSDDIISTSCCYEHTTWRKKMRLLYCLW